MPSKLTSRFAIFALMLLTACQAISDQTMPDQESVAQIDNRSIELEQAAEASVNRQIEDIMSESDPMNSEAAANIAQ